MRSFIAVACCVLLLVGTSIAAASVKLPSDFTVPAKAKLTGKMLYDSLAYSHNTLARGVDVSSLATYATADSTLLGNSAKHTSTLVIVPEEFELEDATGKLADNSFPLMEMSLTLSTAIVLPGMSEEMKDAFYLESVRKITTKYGIKIEDLSASLGACGIAVGDKIIEDSYTLNGVDFDVTSMNEVLYASAVACSMDFNEQVTVVDLRSAYNYARKYYGSNSAHVEAVMKMIRSVVGFLSGKTTSFVIATNEDFFNTQRIPDFDFEVVSPRQSSALTAGANAMASASNTGAFQITLWFTIFVVVVVAVVTLLTCGVGVDIEKDTLLYQTTALRGQPVL